MTSANASTNGLGVDSASSATWIEAGYLTTDVAPIRAWFEALWEISSAITDADLAAAEAAWSGRQKAVWRPPGTSHDTTPVLLEGLVTLPRSKRRNMGAQLNSQWNVGAQHALYRANGTWCHWLQRFPGALFDANGYVRFETEDDLLGCSGVRVGERANWLNVPDGIASLPGYVTVQQA